MRRPRGVPGVRLGEALQSKPRGRLPLNASRNEAGAIPCEHRLNPRGIGVHQLGIGPRCFPAGDLKGSTVAVLVAVRDCGGEGHYRTRGGIIGPEPGPVPSAMQHRGGG